MSSNDFYGAFRDPRSELIQARNSEMYAAFLKVLESYSPELSSATALGLAAPTKVHDPEIQEPFHLYMGHDGSEAAQAIIPDLRVAAKSFCTAFKKAAADLPATSVEHWAAPRRDDTRTLLTIETNPEDFHLILERIAAERAPEALPHLDFAAALLTRVNKYKPAHKMN